VSVVSVVNDRGTSGGGASADETHQSAAEGRDSAVKRSPTVQGNTTRNAAAPAAAPPAVADRCAAISIFPSSHAARRWPRRHASSSNAPIVNSPSGRRGHEPRAQGCPSPGPRAGRFRSDAGRCTPAGMCAPICRRQWRQRQREEGAGRRGMLAAAIKRWVRAHPGWTSASRSDRLGRQHRDPSPNVAHGAPGPRAFKKPSSFRRQYAKLATRSRVAERQNECRTHVTPTRRGARFSESPSPTPRSRG